MRQEQPLHALALLSQATHAAQAALAAGTSHLEIRYAAARAESLTGAAYAALAEDPHRSEARQEQDWLRACESYEKAQGSLRALAAIWFEAGGEASQAGAELKRCKRALAPKAPQPPRTGP
jgi:hypothetical protein